MSTYYYKNSQIVTPFTIVSNEPVFDTDTISLRKQRSSQSAQRWEISFTTVESNNAVEQLMGAVEGLESSDTMVMPQLNEVASASTINGNPDVQSDALPGVSSVTMSASGVSGVLPRGSFVTFSNNPKLYVVTATVDFSTGSTKSVGIFPTLRTAVTTSDSMNVNDSALITYYRSVDNLQGVTYNDGLLSSSGDVTLIEALS